jgi:replication fork protection complex subunit Tof1/Swi1
MEESTDEDDQEIAENIQNRIFYEGITHDRIITLLRSYKDQGIGYLNAATELSHVFIRMLENYSKQNADMQIRSRHRARKRQAKEASSNEAAANDEEVDDVEAFEQVSRERKFDFHRFSARFATQGCIDTFVAFTRLYKDMSSEQLKRAHRFFYRVAFKLELCTMLFRVDIIQLFYNMIKGANPLEKESSSFREWEELIRQLFKKLTKRLNDHPELMIEMLFSKIPQTLFYLENGYDKLVTKAQPRPPAELDIRPEISPGDRIALVTEVLVAGAKFDTINWVKEVVKKADIEREAWEAANDARRTALVDSVNPEIEQTDKDANEQPKPPVICKYSLSRAIVNTNVSIVLPVGNDSLKTDLFKDNKLRLLLKLIGFERLDLEDIPGATWMLPSSVTSAELKVALEKIQNGERGDTLASYPNAKAPEQYLRRKPNAIIQDDDNHIVLQSDSEGEESFDENLLFPAGGPTAYTSNRPAKPKKNILRRKQKDVGDEEKAERAEARRKKELEKRRRIKSDVFIHASDDETDEERDREFYAKEDERRRETGQSIMKAIEAANKDDVRKRKGEPDDTMAGSSRKRRAIVSDNSDSEVEMDNSQEMDVIEVPGNSSSPESEDSELNIGLGSEEESEDTPDSSQPPVRTAVELDVDADKENRTGDKNSEDVIMRDVRDEDEDDSPIKHPVRRRNVRAGFVIDDSDSE